MKIKIFTVLLTTCLVINTVSLCARDVYVAGAKKNATVFVAGYWKNGSFTTLGGGTYTSYGQSVFVSGNNVYIGGYENNVNGKTVAKCWLNGVETSYSNGSYNASIKSVYVKGSDVFFAGYDGSASISRVAKYWKNGIGTILGTRYSSALSVFISGSDVYVAGSENDTQSPAKSQAKYWKNGVAVILSGESTSNLYATSIYVVSDDVYVAGYEITSGGINIPKYWKNGVPINLTMGTTNTENSATSIYVSENNIYVSGYENTNFVAKCWNNGSASILTSTGFTKTKAKAVFVHDNNVYVAGWGATGAIGSMAVYWKDGVATLLETTAADALAIMVVDNPVSISSEVSASTLGNCANCDITVDVGGILKVDTPLNVDKMTVNSGGQLTLNSGNTLDVSGSFTLKSDATNGTGTFVDLTTNGGLTVDGTTAVEQYLSSSQTGSNGRNWYISSPLSAALTSDITTATGNGLVFYNGTSWEDAGTTMDVIKGYIAKSPAQNTTINFIGGSLNTGAKSTTNLPVGFNLVGNPYPSYVNWSNAVKTGIASTIWYRSKSTGSYLFQTYNVVGEGVGANGGTNIIPPMQSFWVKATNATNTLGFTNDMRSHQDQSILTNRLKAPKVSVQKLLRLQVSNGINNDEAIVYFNSNAQDNIDEYDSPKMFNNIIDVPEIFTKVSDNNLVINGMSEVKYNIEISLGFSALESNYFSIKATEFNNFDADTKIILLDKELKTENDLTNGTAYNFESGITNTSNRFSLIFRTKGTTTDLENNTQPHSYVFVDKYNHISIEAPEKSNYVIYNALGQKQFESVFDSSKLTINKNLDAGVYFVVLSVNGKRKVDRIIIR